MEQVLIYFNEHRQAISIILACITTLMILLLLFNFTVITIKYVKKKYNATQRNLDEKLYLEHKKKIVKDHMKRGYIDEIDFQSMQPDQIVDVTKPVGPWTRKILSEKIALIKEIAHSMKKAEANNENVGYWQLFIRAVHKAQGRHKDKGR